MREGVDVAGQTVIASIAFVTSNCIIFDSAVLQNKSESEQPTPAASSASPSDDKNKPADSPPPGSPPTPTKTSTFLPPTPQHSLRGLFTFSASPSSSFPSGTPCSLGVVWSKDTFVPLLSTLLSLPILTGSFLALSPPLRDSVSRFKTLNTYAHFGGRFLLGAAATAIATAAAGQQKDSGGGTTPFNALDRIDLDWEIKSIAFAGEEGGGRGGGGLAGLKVGYANGKELVHGSFERELWRCEVRSDLVVAKITAGRMAAGGRGVVDTVEFVRAEEDSGNGGRRGELGLAEWPLDVATVRYLGEDETRVGVDVDVVVERAPSMGGNAVWSLRGFYGEFRDGLISSLAIVWGRG